MAYKGKRKGRRGGGRKRGLLKKVSKMINRKIAHNTELKYVPTSDTSSADVSGVFFNLSNCAQGDTDTTRDGDKYTPKKLFIRLVTAAADTTQLFRVIIFRWKQNTLSVSPTAAYLLSPYSATALAPIAPYNHDTRANYQILYDKCVSMSTNAYPLHVFKKTLNLSKLPKISFDSGTTNGNNQIYMYVVSDSSISTHPGFSFISRLFFVDS